MPPPKGRHLSTEKWGCRIVVDVESQLRAIGNEGWRCRLKAPNILICRLAVKPKLRVWRCHTIVRLHEHIFELIDVRLSIQNKHYLVFAKLWWSYVDEFSRRIFPNAVKITHQAVAKLPERPAMYSFATIIDGMSLRRYVAPIRSISIILIGEDNRWINQFKSSCEVNYSRVCYGCWHKGRFA